VCQRDSAAHAPGFPEVEGILIAAPEHPFAGAFEAGI